MEWQLAIGSTQIRTQVYNLIAETVPVAQQPYFGCCNILNRNFFLLVQLMSAVGINQHFLVKQRFLQYLFFVERRYQNTNVDKVFVQKIDNIFGGCFHHFNENIRVFLFVVSNKNRQ